MKYAFSRCDITARMPVKQAGFIQQTEKITAVKDRLYASVFGIESDIVLLFISADSLGMADTIRQAILKQICSCFAKPVSLVLSCTHTHFAPDAKDEAYAEQFIGQAVQMIREMQWTDAEDLQVSLVRERYEEVGRSRISRHPSKEVWLNVISLYDGDRVLLNIGVYNCHPTVMDGYTPFFSAEYPGQLRMYMEEAFPGVPFIFWQSAAGDISTRFTRTSQSYEAMCELAGKLAEETKKLIGTEKKRYPVIGISYQETDIPLHHVFEPIDISSLPEGLTEREKETIRIGQKVRENLAGTAADLPDHVTFAKAALGPLQLLFCPKELFSEYLTYVKNDMAVLVCYSNGYGGYVTPPGFADITYERFTDTWSQETKKEVCEVIGRLSEPEK